VTTGFVTRRDAADPHRVGGIVASGRPSSVIFAVVSLPP
jgi:hypothetical protein